MQRRRFLATSLAGSAAALTAPLLAQTTPAPAAGSREFYALRRYSLQSGPQTKLTETYFAGALLPALKRLEMGPVGAFRLEFGPETPTYYLLIPSSSLEKLVTLDLHLARDAEFAKAAEPFWNAPASAPAFGRVESSLLAAFAGWPHVVPPSGVGKTNRVLQLRTYESPSDRDHARKVEMFHSGEFDIFRRNGFHQVFFGDTLIGPRLPNLTYMLAFADVTELNARWDAFRADADWHKLSGSPRFAFEPIVSNVSNLVLSPLACSEI